MQQASLDLTVQNSYRSLDTLELSDFSLSLAKSVLYSCNYHKIDNYDDLVKIIAFLETNSLSGNSYCEISDIEEILNIADINLKISNLDNLILEVNDDDLFDNEAIDKLNIKPLIKFQDKLSLLRTYLIEQEI